jgi:prepilin-type N-terminal cleavage/methylation domain-containing protein
VNRLSTPRVVRQALRRPRTRGFSLVEMLVALTISSTLLAATMVALDTMFKQYTVVSDSASTHVVSRTVMHRLLSMVRTGTEFGPYPADVLDPAQNPLTVSELEFVSFENASVGIREVSRFEERDASTATIGSEQVTLRGPKVLWLVTETDNNGSITTVERPLLDGVVSARFTLQYDVGPQLRRATIDLTIEPRGSEVASFNAETGAWSVRKFDAATNQYVDQRLTASEATRATIRLVASAEPRTSE